MSAAYPLQWPQGWPRTPSYKIKSAPFGTTGRTGYKTGLTVAEARERLQAQLDLLGAKLPVLSTNLELRLDGLPRSGEREPQDRGAAVYFQLGGRPTVLACDRWNRVADNIAAIAKHIEALRGMDRWGVGTAAQAFAGYQAIAAPRERHWREVLGIHPGSRVSRADIESIYRIAARKAHPDAGGSNEAMAELNRARDQALAEIG